MNNIKLKSIIIIFIITASSLTPYLSNIFIEMNESDENIDEVLGDTEYLNYINKLNKLNNILEENNLPLETVEKDINSFTDLQNPPEYLNISYDGENYTIEEYKRHQFDNSLISDYFNFGELPSIEDTIKANLNKEVLNSYLIISKEKIGEKKEDAIQKTLTSYRLLAKVYDVELSEEHMNNVEINLRENVISNDYLLHINWIFKNGLNIDTYGIYDNTEVKFIFDPVLNSFPNSYLSEEKKVITYSNNSIMSGVEGYIQASIVLYYVFIVRVDWLRIDYTLSFRTSISPMPDSSNQVTQKFSWTASGVKTLLHWTGALDAPFVCPKYSLPYIKFYYDGTLKSTQSQSMVQAGIGANLGHSNIKSTTFSQSVASTSIQKNSFVSFQFQYGYQYFLIEGLLNYYWSTNYYPNTYTKTLVGVSPSQFLVISKSVTEVLLGVEFNINVRIRNPNPYRAKCTLSVDMNSLIVNGDEILQIKSGTPSSQSEILQPNQEKIYVFTFIPLNGGGPFPIKFDSSLRIYEDYYEADQFTLSHINAKELGPSVASTGTINIEIEDDLPAFTLEKDQLNILNYEKGFFEPGDMITIQVTNLENIGKLAAKNLSIALYCDGLPNPVSIYRHVGDVAAGDYLTFNFPAFSLTKFNTLPNYKNFYVIFNYSWFGNPSYQLITMLDADMKRINWDLIIPVIDFYWEDSGEFSDRNLECFLKVNYAGNRLDNFTYDIDTYQRKLSKDPSLGQLTDLNAIWGAFKNLRSKTIAQTLTSTLNNFLSSHIAAYRSAETTIQTNKKWPLIVLADFAGYAYYFSISWYPRSWEENVDWNVKDGSADYNPSSGTEETVTFSVDKKPYLAGAAGNLGTIILPSSLCGAFDKAEYKFEITIELTDIYGNKRIITHQTTTYTKGVVEVGKVLGWSIYGSLTSLKDQFMCKASAFLVAAAIYTVIGIIASAATWFTGGSGGIYWFKTALICALLGALYLLLAEIILGLIYLYLLSDPETQYLVEDIAITNFANDSLSGIGNNFANSANKVKNSSSYIANQTYEQTNSIVNNESITYALDESFDELSDTTSEFSRAADLFVEESNKQDMSFIDSEEFNNTFEEAVGSVNSSGVPSSISALGKDLDLDSAFIDSLEEPGLVRGNPEVLKNITLFTSYCVAESVNISGNSAVLDSALEEDALDHMNDKSGIVATNIPEENLTLLEEYSQQIVDHMNQQNYDDALLICNQLEKAVDQIVSETHNSSILLYKKLALRTKSHILSKNDFFPSVYSDKLQYSLGDSGTISTEIHNIADKEDNYTIDIIDEPSFINLEFPSTISANSNSKAIISIQPFEIPLDWHISAGVYNITLLFTSERFGKTKQITLSFEILPFHNTTIYQTQDYISLEPGESSMINYEIHNFGNYRENILISIDGIEPYWYDLSSRVLSISSGEIFTYGINISIPHSNLIAPKIYTVQTNFSTYTNFIFSWELEILPFYALSTEYLPLDKDIIVPGESATSYLSIENLGNTPVTIIIDIGGSVDPLWVNITSPIVLAVGEAINLTSTLTPEKLFSTSPGIYNFSYIISLLEDPNLILEVRDTITILAFFESEISVNPLDYKAEIGDVVEYNLIIKNLGNIVSDYLIERTPWNTTIVNNWTTLTESYVSIAPGDTKVVKLIVQIPYFWESMDPIHAICKLEINRINESMTTLYNLSVRVQSTPPNMIYYLINKISQLYDLINIYVDSCLKYRLLCTLERANKSLNAALFYYNKQFLNYSVFFEIFSRDELKFSSFIIDFANFFSLLNNSFSTYLKNELYDCQDYISLLIGTTINIILNQKIGTELSLIEIKHNELFQVLDGYNLCPFIQSYIKMKLNSISLLHSLLYIYTAFEYKCLFNITVDILVKEYNLLLCKLSFYKTYGFISEEFFIDMANKVSEIQNGLLNLNIKPITILSTHGKPFRTQIIDLMPTFQLLLHLLTSKKPLAIRLCIKQSYGRCKPKLCEILEQSIIRFLSLHMLSHLNYEFQGNCRGLNDRIEHTLGKNDKNSTKMF
ncbi:MAG: hypothetical protein ACFFDK_13230 [Promethearchaeota archaeon]